MATNWLAIAGSGVGVSTGEGSTVNHYLFGTIQTGGLSEAVCQFVVRESYTWSNMFCRVPANGNPATTTMRSRIGGVNGNQVLTIAGSTTGIFEDTSNTDALVAGNLINYQFIDGGAEGEATTYTLMCSVLAHAGSTGPMGSNDESNAGVTADNFYPLAGDASQTTTEANTQLTARAMTAIRNLRGYNRDTSTTNQILRSRVNGGNGAQSVTITASSAGWYEDTTNTDTLAAGDEFNAMFDFQSGTSASLDRWGCEADGATRHAYVGATSIAATTTRYAPLNGSGVNATESTCQYDCGKAVTLKNLFVNVTVNASATAPIVGLRKNGSTVITISVTALTTGVFEETSTQVEVADGDDINYIFTAGITAGFTPQICSIEQLAAVEGKTLAVQFDDQPLWPRIRRIIEGEARSLVTTLLHPIPVGAFVGYGDNPRLIYRHIPIASDDRAQPLITGELFPTGAFMAQEAGETQHPARDLRRPWPQQEQRGSTTTLIEFEIPQGVFVGLGDNPRLVYGHIRIGADDHPQLVLIAFHEPPAAFTGRGDNPRLVYGHIPIGSDDHPQRTITTEFVIPQGAYIGYGDNPRLVYGHIPIGSDDHPWPLLLVLHPLPYYYPGALRPLGRMVRPVQNMPRPIRLRRIGR